MQAFSSLCNDSSEGIFCERSSFLEANLSLTPKVSEYGAAQPLMCLYGAIVGDIPARYTIASVPEYEFPAVGIYLDRRILPGFRYRVRVLPYLEGRSESIPHYLFGGAALNLRSIGRGYSRRLVFEPDSSCSLNDNHNFFWTDSHPGGVALELQVISIGDCFHVLSEKDVLLGRCTIRDILGPQIELTQEIEVVGVRKIVKLQLEFQMQWIDYRIEPSMKRVSALAECVKKKDEKCAKIMKVTFGGQGRSFHLTPFLPGYYNITVGSCLNGFPTQHQVEGLLDSEFTVIGTYVDPRILPGFKYKVRKLSSKTYLFQNQALKLLSVGVGYGKKITFEPDVGTLNEPNNFFWSDSVPEGYGFQPVALEKGCILKLFLDNCYVRDLEIAYVASLQKEMTTRVTSLAVEVVYEVDLVCRWCNKIDFKTDWSSDLFRITGSALLRKANRAASAELSCIRHLNFLRSYLSISSDAECLLLPG